MSVRNAVTFTTSSRPRDVALPDDVALRVHRHLLRYVDGPPGGRLAPGREGPAAHRQPRAPYYPSAQRSLLSSRATVAGPVPPRLMYTRPITPRGEDPNAADVRRTGGPRRVPGPLAPARGQARRLLRRSRRLASGETRHKRHGPLHGARRGKPPRRLPAQHRDRGDPGRSPWRLRGLSRRRAR